MCKIPLAVRRRHDLIEGGAARKNVANEIRFFIKEFTGEVTYINRLSKCKGGRLIVSAYAGNTLVAAALLKKRKLNRWEFAFMVVHKKARSCGLGSMMAKLVMRMIFDTGATAVYITAERVEDKDGNYVLEKESPVARYWKRLGFRRTTFRDILDTIEEDEIDIVPLKMGSRSKHVKALPSVADSISSILKVTRKIGKKRGLTKKNTSSLRIISPWLGEYKTDGEHSWINGIRFDPMSKVLAEVPARMQSRMENGIEMSKSVL